MKLVLAFCFIFLAQVISYLQLQGSTRWPILKSSTIILASTSILIGFLLIKFTETINAHFQATWQGRLIGQGVGLIVFSLMSWIVFREPITIKTGICIALSVIIILINMYWK